jgi:preprotein translocase subunit SecG
MIQADENIVNERGRITAMKKLMTLMLGLAFAITTVAVAQEKTDAPKTEKKKKAPKKKKDEKKDEKK